MSHALLVDDSVESLEALRAVVEREGFSVTCAGTLAGAYEAIEQKLPDVILLDLKLPDGDGLELLERLDSSTRPDVVLITGHASVATAVAALRERVADYLVKPVDLQRLRSVLRHVIRTRDLREEVNSLRSELRQLGRFGRFIGRSPAMQEVFDRIARVAPTDATVLVTGESGTGKELVARTIHELSVRRHGPFRAVNCGAIATELLESELFGHEKGAFTGAERRHHGYFEQAASGTLFLDEITEMAPGNLSRSTFALSRPRTSRRSRRSPAASCARISTTGSRCSPFTFHRCGTAATTSACWRSTCCMS